jgi:hypothetical protein
MGWIVRARQRVREHQRVDLAERWKGKRYAAKGNIGTVVADTLLYERFPVLFDVLSDLTRQSSFG